MGIKKSLILNTVLLLLLLFNGFVLNKDFPESLYIYSPDNEILTNDYDELQKISQEQFGISYYAKSYGNIKTDFRNISANIYGVNELYEPYNNIFVKEGSFITLSHEENSEKAAVLNLNAAFSLFGTAENISGETIIFEGENYIVCGVVNDNEKTADNIYIPITSLNKGIKEMIVPLDEAATKERIVSTLENSGLLGASVIKKTGDYTEPPKYMALFSLYLFVCFAAILLLVFVLFRVFEEFKNIHSLSQKMYFRELISNHKIHFLKAISKILLWSILLFSAFIVLEKMVLIYLEYFDILKEMVKNNFNINNYKFQTFAGRTMYSYIYIIMFLINMIYLFYISLVEILNRNWSFHKPL